MLLEIPADVFRQATDIIKNILSFKEEGNSQLLIESVDDGLYLASTDGSIFTTIYLPYNVFSDIIPTSHGKAYVDVVSFLKIAAGISPYNEKSKTGCELVTLEDKDEGRFGIRYVNKYKSGKTLSNEREINKFEVGSVDKELNDDLGDSYLIFPAGVFFEAASKVLYASGVNELDMNLGNVLFELKDNRLQLTCTSGIKLATSSFELQEGSYSDVKSFLVPVKFVQRFFKVVNKSDTENVIVLSIQNNKLLIKSSNNYTYITCPIYRGGFPDCSTIFDGDSESVVFDKEMFEGAIQSLSYVSDSDSKNRISLEFKDGVCTTSVVGMTTGKTVGLSFAKKISDSVIDFNSKFLLETLKNVKTDFFSLSIYKQGVKRAAISEIDGDVSFNSIIVPLKRY